MEGAPRPLPLPRASSLATRPRRREEVGGLWDHAGDSLRHPIPSNPPGEAQDPEAKLGIKVMGTPRQPPWILPAASQEPPLGACVQGLPRGHGETREGDLPSQPGCFAPSFLGLCLSPAPQCSSVTPWPPLSDPGGWGGSHVSVPTTCQGSVKRGHRRLRRPPQERPLPAGTRRPQHSWGPWSHQAGPQCPLPSPPLGHSPVDSGHQGQCISEPARPGCGPWPHSRPPIPAQHPGVHTVPNTPWWPLSGALQAAGG